MSQQTVTPAAVNAAAKRMAAKAKQMLGHSHLQAKLKKIRQKKEQPNSSIMVIFYDVHPDDAKHDPSYAEATLIDTVTGEIFDKYSRGDEETCLRIEVKPLDEIAEDEFSNVGFEVFAHSHFDNKDSILWPIAKLAFEVMRQEKVFKLDFEFAFKKSGYWDHGLDGSEWNEEYEPMGMVRRKTYHTQDFNKFIKNYGKLPPNVVKIGDKYVRLSTKPAP